MYLLNIIFLLTSAHFTFNYFFKQQYQYFLFNLSYNFLYNCGRLEILLKQQYNQLLNNPYIEKIFDKIEDLHTSFKKYDTIIILNNKVVARSVHNSIIYDVGYKNLQYSDFMIYNQSVKRKKTNQVVFYGILDFALFINKIENCSYEFLSLNVKIDYPGMESKNVDIVFSNNKETLYVVTNRINVLMISYLLKLQHNIETDPLLLSYEINIIDQNVKFFRLNEKEELILFENHYEKVPFDLNKIKERRLNGLSHNAFTSLENENSESKLSIDTKNILKCYDSDYNTQNENIIDYESDNSYEHLE